VPVDKDSFDGETDYNNPVIGADVIEVFRANGGEVGGFFTGMPMIVLHHRGAKTGIERESPLVCQIVDDSWAVFASKGGGPSNPDWYYNLKANPDCQVEFGADIFRARARELQGEERQKIWEEQKRLLPGYIPYEESTRGIREIPVIMLERQA